MPLEFDLECEVKDGGVSSQAGAIRLATAVALQSFVDKPVIEKMRLGWFLFLAVHHTFVLASCVLVTHVTMVVLCVS